MGERLLIVNADDFGLTDGVCLGILVAHDRGLVRSTSALAVAPSFALHAAALGASGLAVGAHLAAVGEDRPVLSKREIPTLVDEQGCFPLTWRQFVRRAASGAVDTDDLRREFAAQLEVLQQHGLELSHIDSHQNLHLWPQVATVVVELAERHRIGAVRVPRTQRWTPTSIGVRSLSVALRRRLTGAQIAFPAASVGLDEAGGMNEAELARAVTRFARSTAASLEAVVHLARDPDPQRSRYRTNYEWADELEAVCSDRIRSIVERNGLRLGSFVDLSVAARG
ncbi:MAG: ChbG/HpnK family deacetylase [Actinomycetes bacterium]